jgi:hypothetical protein
MLFLLYCLPLLFKLDGGVVYVVVILFTIIVQSLTVGGSCCCYIVYHYCLRFDRGVDDVVVIFSAITV